MQLKVAAAALNQTPLDWEHNRDNVIAVLQEARKEGVQVLCCPELVITGYGCEDMFLSTNTCRVALEMLNEIIPHTHNMFVVLGLPLLYQNALYNTVAVVVDKKLIGFVAKQHLAYDGVYYEPRWFKPWRKGEKVDIHFDGQDYPLGDLIFNFEGARIGFEICEDAWVAARTGLKLAERGVDLILNPSASHFAFKKHDIRKHFVLEGARAFGVAYLYANLLGNEAGRLIFDGDTMIANPEGFVATGPRFSFHDFVITYAHIDIDALRMKRTRVHYPSMEIDNVFLIQCPAIKSLIPLTSDKIKKTVLEVVGVLVKTGNDNKIHQTKDANWEQSDNIQEEEFSRAVALGLFDYLRKSNSHGFVLNLSGGADSATCACLVYLAVQLGLQELGEAEFRRKLKYISLPEKTENFMQMLLYCLYQRTENNSTTTETAATRLAMGLGASFFSFSINDLVNTYCALLNPIVHRPLSWQRDDLALQNIQARVRGPSAWLLANVRGALLLSPSNRSEASVGYATMDGDTSGSLCPIAGVSKSFIIHWLSWMADHGLQETGPLPVLKYITVQKPTAELRPPKEEQTDEDDLMPYAWLDTIEHLFVLGKQSPLDILKSLTAQYPSENPKNLAESIELFFVLWSKNQWKRERLAPSFHIDEESVDPKTWCRFPILSGGFTYEIKKMWDYIG